MSYPVCYEVQLASLRHQFPEWRVWWSAGQWQAYRYGEDIGINVHVDTASQMQARLRALSDSFDDLAEIATDRVVRLRSFPFCDRT